MVVGLDVSQTMLHRAVHDTAEAGFDQVAYVRGDAVDLPFVNASFDAVCCFAAPLNLFADPYAALDSFTRVLTPGGRLAIFTSVRGRSPLRTFESALRVRSGMNMFERDELVEALAERGFTDVRQRLSGMTQLVGGRLEE